MNYDNFKPNTLYKITVPPQEYGVITFKEVNSVLKYLDKDSNLDKLTPYQRELAYRHSHTLWEDELGSIVVLRLKDDYKIEEVVNEISN